MEYYPIFLDLKGRPCLVIGGGPVAERKVEKLLEAGAEVTLISPSITDRLRVWAAAEKICHKARAYHYGDLAPFQLAFVATDDAAVNMSVKREGEERGVWVNVADDPSHCDFILPSVLRRGDLVVAVATGGSSPALSRAIREELERYFTEEYALLSEIVAEVRRELRERGISATPEIWGRALNGSLRSLVQRRDIEGAKRYLREQVSGHAA
jgi:precorrin-2 dehydrogenase/sirohydrochlorin ferrochelatase